MYCHSTTPAAAAGVGASAALDALWLGLLVVTVAAGSVAAARLIPRKKA